LSRDEEYPISAMKKLMMIKLEEFNLKNKNEFTDSKMAKEFAQDDLVNGLCLLQCLKKDPDEEQDTELQEGMKKMLKDDYK
jgi:hypothetical protein